MKKLNRRALKYGANNTVLVVGAIVIFILLNFLASAVSEKFPATRLDLTGNGIFNIGKTTRSVLSDLDESGDDVTVYYLRNNSEEITAIKEIVLKYLGAGKNLKYDTINYVRDPAAIQKYGDVGTLSEGSLIVDDATTGRFRVIAYEDMFEYDSQNNLRASAIESRLTNAIAYCISRDETLVCFSTGHGEADPGEMGGVLQAENISSNTFDLKVEDVPEDCEALLVICPIIDFTAEEIDRLDDYLDRGGNVQVAIDPLVDLPRLEGYLTEWGVTLNNDFVLEGDPGYMISDQQTGMSMIYPHVAEDAITEDITSKNLRVMAILCRSLNVAEVPGVEITRKTLFYTSKNGMAMDMESGETSDGSFDLLVSLEKPVGEKYDKKARLIVGGSGSFWGATSHTSRLDLSGLLSEPGLGNNAFFVGSIYDMLDIGGTKLTIESKSLTSSTLVMTESQQKIYRILFCWALPAVIVLLGLVIWLRRRHL